MPPKPLTIPKAFEKISAWIKTNKALPRVYKPRKPATASELKALETALGSISPEHRALLALTNGWGNFRSYDVLDCKQVRTRTEWLRKRGPFGLALIAFAEDSGGNLLCVSQLSSKISMIDRTSGPVMPNRETLAGWLTAYFADLESGAEALDAEGFISEA